MHRYRFIKKLLLSVASFGGFYYGHSFPSFLHRYFCLRLAGCACRRICRERRVPPLHTWSELGSLSTECEFFCEKPSPLTSLSPPHAHKARFFFNTLLLVLLFSLFFVFFTCEASHSSCGAQRRASWSPPTLSPSHHRRWHTCQQSPSHAPRQ